MLTKTQDELLAACAALHHHLCPRQVLGVRIGMYAAEVLGLDLPQTDKRLLAIAETDGCAVDGISVATGCWTGRRTLRVEDYGKVAATFVDTATGRAVRIAPRGSARTRAREYAPEARGRWHAQLLGYQRMPAEELLTCTEVALDQPLDEIISRPGRRVACARCGEEIINERQVIRDGVTLCRACAGTTYYHLPLGSLEDDAR